MQTEEPLVSILMNCFNGEKFLREAVDSVLAQTYQNWEVIFWDNQSTDKSAEIFKSYSDPRLKYFYAPKHTLLYEARNYAFEKTGGELIAFLDVDDWWLSEKLDRQIVLFRDSDVGLVCSNYFVENKIKGRKREVFKNPMPQGRILESLLQNNFIALVTLMIRRSALKSMPAPFDSRFHIIGDFDLEIRLAATWKVGIEQTPLAVFCAHGDNESGKHGDLMIRELECWYAEHTEHSVIGYSRNFHFVADLIAYYKAMKILLSGNKKDSMKYLNQISWGRSKLKLIAGLLLPVSIFKYLINWRRPLSL